MAEPAQSLFVEFKDVFEPQAMGEPYVATVDFLQNQTYQITRTPDEAGRSWLAVCHYVTPNANKPAQQTPLFELHEDEVDPVVLETFQPKFLPQGERDFLVFNRRILTVAKFIRTGQL